MADCVVMPEHANFCTTCGSLLVVKFGTGDAAECRVCGNKSLSCTLSLYRPRIDLEKTM